MQHEQTAFEVAKRLGCHPCTVTRHANTSGIGRKAAGHIWLFSPTDVRRLRRLVHRKPGRPKTKGQGE